MSENYLYISIPKTGTNSVHEILKNTNYNHLTASVIRNKVGKNNYDSKNTFCFIRNPVDLVKSWYYYHKFSPNVIRQDVKDFYPKTIEEWVFNMKCKTHWQQDLHKKYNPLWDINQNPLFQKLWITDENNNIIVKNVFRFDNLNFTIKKLFNKEIKQRNKSNKNDHKLKSETKEKIEELFHNDILLYNSLKY